MSETISDTWVKRVSYLIIMLLVLALFKMPFAYYQIMKVAVTSYFIIYACVINKCRIDWINILCWILAAVYNPFLQIHVGKSAWMAVNIITIIFCVWLLIKSESGRTIKF